MAAIGRREEYRKRKCQPESRYLMVLAIRSSRAGHGGRLTSFKSHLSKVLRRGPDSHFRNQVCYELRCGGGYYSISIGLQLLLRCHCLPVSLAPWSAPQCSG